MLRFAIFPDCFLNFLYRTPVSYTHLDCPGFETFGADVKAAREAKRLARKTLAEMVGIEWRYLANIENQGAIPSLPVMILSLIHI